MEILYPLDGTVFPPELPPPTFRWKQVGRTRVWRVTVHFTDAGKELVSSTRAPEWTPTEEQWEATKRRSLDGDALVAVEAVGVGSAGGKACRGEVVIHTCPDGTGAPIFYREVNLPFVEAVKDPSRIRWRLGDVSARRAPPVLLENMPVCGNCHSFSADGSVLGMDVDYANDKGSYAIAAVERQIYLTRRKTITWSDYRREDKEPTFGLLSQVSPDGRYVVSTVKDRSVFVATPGLEFSQLFFPIKGILAVYDRQSRTFRSLPGADDRQFVQSNPAWSPDGKYIVFARAPAYKLRRLTSDSRVLLTREECKEFLNEGKTFLFDLYRIPFNGGEGGEAKPLAGASHNGVSNFFPKYSPSGKWIVFCKARSFMLLQPDSELYIVPADGGQARRLLCNTGRMNSWHSWSPNGKWLVFSSKANGPFTQLFLTHIDEQGRSSPPVVLSRFIAADRAANIPEFVNIQPGAIASIQGLFLDAHSYFRAAVALSQGGDQLGAAEAFAKVLALEPDHAEAHAALGALLASTGAHQQARGHLTKALELQPGNATARAGLGLLLAKQGNLVEAVNHHRRALEIDPRCVVAHLNLSLALADQGKLPEAIAHCRGALELDPALRNARGALGRMLVETGQLDQAETCLRQAVQEDSNSPVAHAYLGVALLEKGRPTEAAACARRALQLDSRNVAAMATIAIIESGADSPPPGDGRTALQLATEACKLSGFRSARAVDALARALAALGQFDAAGRAAEKALRLARAAGNEPLAAAIRQRLDLYNRRAGAGAPAPATQPAPTSRSTGTLVG